MKNPDQLSLFDDSPVVHYFDKNGALRSGHLLRRIRKGKRQGQMVVADSDGRIRITRKIRNISSFETHSSS